VAKTPEFRAGQELTMERSGHTARTTLRGWKAGHYLLMDMPDASWAADDKSPIIGRLSGNGVYYGFNSEFIGALREFKLLIIRFPEDITETSYRKSERFNATLPVTVITESPEGKREEKGVITDISDGGCQLACHSSFAKDSTLFLGLNLPTGQTLERLPCIIRGANRNKNLYVYGLQFDVAEEKTLEPLRQFLAQVDLYRAPEGSD